VRCTADGQARAVLALWLGAQATPGGDVLLWRTIEEGGDGSYLTFPEWDAPPTWGVKFRLVDARAALDVLVRPRDQVIAVLRANRELLSHPSTPAIVLAEFLGLPPRPIYVESHTQEACR
jgi:hypothetical protein